MQCRINSYSLFLLRYRCCSLVQFLLRLKCEPPAITPCSESPNSYHITTPICQPPVVEIHPRWNIFHEFPKPETSPSHRQNSNASNKDIFKLVYETCLSIKARTLPHFHSQFKSARSSRNLANTLPFYFISLSEPFSSAVIISCRPLD